MSAIETQIRGAYDWPFFNEVMVTAIRVDKGTFYESREMVVNKL